MVVMKLIGLFADSLEALNNVHYSFAYRTYSSLFFTSIYLKLVKCDISKKIQIVKEIPLLREH